MSEGADDVEDEEEGLGEDIYGVGEKDGAAAQALKGDGGDRGCHQRRCQGQCQKISQNEILGEVEETYPDQRCGEDLAGYRQGGSLPDATQNRVDRSLEKCNDSAGYLVYAVL